MTRFTGKLISSIVQTMELFFAQLSRPWNFFLRCFPSLGLCICAVFVAVPIFGSEKSESVSSFENLVGKLTELQLQISSEKRAWREQEPQWRREITLLHVEKEQLEKEMAEYRAEQGILTEDRAKLLERKQTLSTAVAKLKKTVRDAEKDIQNIYQLVPKPIASGLDDAFKKLPDSDDAASRQPLPQRLQRVIALYASIQKFQHELRVTRSVVALDNGGREMDVIYLGLSRAFAVSSDNNSAASGHPEKTNWKWIQNDDIATSVRRAISIFNKEEPAELTHLPLQIGGSGK